MSRKFEIIAITSDFTRRRAEPGELAELNETVARPVRRGVRFWDDESVDIDGLQWMTRAWTLMDFNGSLSPIMVLGGKPVNIGVSEDKVRDLAF